jgi:hypothetical protein
MTKSMKVLLMTAAVVALPAMASAVTVSAINDYSAALSNVDKTQSLSLPGTWLAAPLTVNPDASLGGQYRSPFETDGQNSAGYWSVGVGSTYGGTANPAVLELDALSKSISLFWGSPDSYNNLELYKGGSLVGTINGAQFTNQAIEASFVTISADSFADTFDTVKFYSVGANAFEFSNLNIAPVPLPASGLLLIGGMGLLAAARRKRKA